MNHIANHRYVVIGEHAERRAPIVATDDKAEASRALASGRTVNGRHWTGVRVHDRRTEGIMPERGWHAR